MNWGYVLHQPRHRQSKSIFFVLIVVFLTFGAGLAPAQTQTDSAHHLIEYLTQEKTNLTLANNEIKSSQEKPPADQPQLITRKEQNKRLLTLTEAKIVSLENFLANQRKQQQNLAARLKKLQQSPIGKSEGMVVLEKINKINALNEVNDNAIALIMEDLALARHYRDALLVESRQLEVWQAKFDEQQRLEDLHKRIKVLEEARARLYDKNLELQQKKLNKNANTSFNNEARLLLNNQAIILIQYRITELDLQKKLIKAEYLSIRNQDIKTIQSVTDTYKNAIGQLASIQKSLKKMMNVLQQEQGLVKDLHLQQQFSNIQKTAALRLSQIAEQQQNLEKDYEKKQQQLKEQLSIRQGLTEYHLEGWPSIMEQLLLMPTKFYGYFKALALKVKGNYIWLDAWSKTLFWATLGFMVMLAFILRRMLRSVTIKLEKERFKLSGHLYDGILILLYRNVLHLTLIAALIITAFFNRIVFGNYQLLLNLLFVWVTFRSFILIARLTLLESISDTTGQDVKLYYRLKWLLIVGGWATALMVFSHQLPLSLLLQDIFNRLFMLFLLAVSWVTWRSKDIIPYVFLPLLKTKKRYLRNAVSLLSILVPLILLTTAVIGLIGYIHLAWILSRYEAYLLLLITGYVLVRGLLFDAMELLSEWMISFLSDGWLWIEVILKPLDKILRVCLLLTSIVILFQLFGWYSDSLVVTSIKQYGRYALVDVSGVHITLVSILKFILVLCLFIWVAKWTREFSYRWLYRNTEDVGIRNSLSVFTQYAVILVGGFITLRVLGLDFSGMSMILGGLAVGMGFGLRDFASNIVGGIMLLIERPVREGDLITIGEHEGRVAHIGIRSMRVSSWDNMEVLIPNAETFNKPFTNWTHQDSVVRTVVPIKVSREDDPVMVQELMVDVIFTIPEILNDPAPQVFLKQIDDALIEFEVRYFINVQLHTRFEIRSKLLFALMARFKAAGIKSPIPPINVELQKAEDGLPDGS